MLPVRHPVSQFDVSYSKKLLKIVATRGRGEEKRGEVSRGRERGKEGKGLVPLSPHDLFARCPFCNIMR